MSFKAILAFEDGSVFHGKGFGKEKYDVGELVFNTSMTGYQEIITDPSYKKQIITFTHPHIGNTGVNKEDNESKTIHASGMVVKNFCDKPSNWRSKATLGEFLNKNEVIYFLFPNSGCDIFFPITRNLVKFPLSFSIFFLITSRL